MTHSHAEATAPLPPPPRMRVRFWGTRGSCTQFPNASEVAEFMRQIALHTIARVAEDIAEQQHNGTFSLEHLLGGKLSAEAIEAYQRRIGLPALPIYGGETTCIEVETSDGDILLFDAGSGLRSCALDLLQRRTTAQRRVIHLFGSHQHLDHRSGLPFARICYAKDPPFTIRIYGTRTFLHTLDRRFGIFSRQLSEITHYDDPVDYRLMSANFQGVELREGGEPEDDDAPPPSFTFLPGVKLNLPKPGKGTTSIVPKPVAPDPREAQKKAEAQWKAPWQIHDSRIPVVVGRTKITPFEVYHGDVPCLAYRVDHGGASFVFCTDHELRHGTGGAIDEKTMLSRQAEDRLRRQCQNADLAYFDAQYFRSEYDGKDGIGSTPACPRRDWGHSCVEDVLERVRLCRIKHALVGHHDPDREWTGQMQMDQRLAQACMGQNFRVELARGDTWIDL